MRFVYADPHAQVKKDDFTKVDSATPATVLDVPTALQQHRETAQVFEDQASPASVPINQNIGAVRQNFHKSQSERLAEDSAMTRMVDDLVEDGNVIPSIDNEYLPPTPPEQTFDDTAIVNDSTYGIASLSLGDSLAWGQTYDQKANATAPRSPLNASGLAISPPLIPQLSSIPHLPDQSGIFAAFSTETNSTPSSPYLRTFGSSESPAYQFGRPHGHSRQNSQHSSRGSVDPWNPSYGAAEPVNGTDSITNSIQTNPSRRHLPLHGMHYSQSAATMLQPAFYGSPWHSEQSGSAYQTPPNGQGG
jgi:hypothetical protein